jgi:MFS family permease
MTSPADRPFADCGPLLVVVSALMLVDTALFTALIPLLPHYVHTLGLSKSEAGVLVAAYPLGTLAGALPGGMLASRMGVRTCMLVGLALMSVAILVFGFAHGAPVLDAARFAQGVGGACAAAGGLAWLAAATPTSNRGAALGVALGSAVGGALLGPIIGALASRVGIGPVFAASSGIGVCLMAAALLLRPAPTTEPQRLRRVLPALSDPGVAAGMWLTCLAGLAFGVVDLLSPLRLSSLGAGADVIAAAFLGAAALEAVLSPAVGRIADRRGRLVPVRVSLAVGVVVAVFIPVIEPSGALVALLVVGLPAFGTLVVPAAAMVSAGADRLGVHQGLGFGLVNLALGVGQGVAALSSGAIAQATNEVVPFALLALAFAGTLGLLTPPGRRLLQRSGLFVHSLD